MKSIPEYLKLRIKELPERPGVYLFKDRDGKVLYIGKALSLKKRVAGHFHQWDTGFSKETVMLSQISKIDVLETPTEAEALLLEASLVKESLPKYNKMLRDDKSYPYLKISGEEYPRLLITRNRKSDGGRYFGPYTDVRLLRKAVKILRIQFPLRTCRTMPKKVCLQYHLELCGGPCEGHQSKEEYSKTVKELTFFLEGKRDALVRNLSKRMKEYSACQDYEKAQAVYESIRALSFAPSLSRRTQKMPSEILDEFQKVFSLPSLPRKIECFDISNIQGKEAVGSMVVFEDGEPSRQNYRRFRIKTVKGIDDYRMMKEVVGRRYERVLADKLVKPDLILIDGGKGHLAAAKQKLDELGLSDWALLSIAKQHEIVFSPGRSSPYVLPPSSDVLQLIRHVRDEAHRFAITYHRRLHRKEALVSRLDGIPGIGSKSKQKLLKKIGSVSKISQATEEDLMRLGGLAPNLAKNVWGKFHLD